MKKMKLTTCASLLFSTSVVMSGPALGAGNDSSNRSGNGVGVLKTGGGVGRVASMSFDKPSKKRSPSHFRVNQNGGSGVVFAAGQGGMTGGFFPDVNSVTAQGGGSVFLS